MTAGVGAEVHAGVTLTIDTFCEFVAIVRAETGSARAAMSAIPRRLASLFCAGNCQRQGETPSSRGNLATRAFFAAAYGSPAKKPSRMAAGNEPKAQTSGRGVSVRPKESGPRQIHIQPSGLDPMFLMHPDPLFRAGMRCYSNIGGRVWPYEIAQWLFYDRRTRRSPTLAEFLKGA